MDSGEVELWRERARGSSGLQAAYSSVFNRGPDVQKGGALAAPINNKWSTGHSVPQELLHRRRLCLTLQVAEVLAEPANWKHRKLKIAKLQPFVPAPASEPSSATCPRDVSAQSLGGSP